MKVFPFFPATDRRIFFSSVSPALERQSNSWDLLSKSPGKAKFPFSAKVPRNQLDFPSQSLLFKENLLPKEVDESSRRDPENKSQSFVFLKRLFHVSSSWALWELLRMIIQRKLEQLLQQHGRSQTVWVSARSIWDWLPLLHFISCSHLAKENTKGPLSKKDFFPWKSVEGSFRSLEGMSDSKKSISKISLSRH